MGNNKVTIKSRKMMQIEQRIVVMRENLDEAMAIVRRHESAGNGNNIRFRDNEHYRALKRKAHGREY